MLLFLQVSHDRTNIIAGAAGPLRSQDWNAAAFTSHRFQRMFRSDKPNGYGFKASGKQLDSLESGEVSKRGHLKAGYLKIGLHCDCSHKVNSTGKAASRQGKRHLDSSARWKTPF